MQYHEPSPIAKATAQQIFESGDINKICDALVAIAFYEEDWLWAQNICLDFLSSDNNALSSLAATCLGHIARIHGKLNRAKVIAALKSHANNAAIAGNIDDALGDIKRFATEASI